MRLLVQKLDPAAKLPVCAHPGQDLGYDLFALEDTVLEPGVPTAVRTGIAAHYSVLFDTYGLRIRNRSSMSKAGVVVGGGEIDAGYRGEILVILINLRQRWFQIKTDPRGGQYLTHDDVRYHIQAGDKIAQMAPALVLTYAAIQEVDKLPDGDRGTAGFGSTGR